MASPYRSAREHVHRGRVIPRADERIRRTFGTVREELLHRSGAEQIEQAPRKRPVPRRDRLADDLAVLIQKQPILPQERRDLVVTLESHGRSHRVAHVQLLSSRVRLPRGGSRTNWRAIAIRGDVRMQYRGPLQKVLPGRMAQRHDRLGGLVVVRVVVPSHECPEKQVHRGVQILACFIREPGNHDDGRVSVAWCVGLNGTHPRLQRGKRRVVDVLARTLGAGRDREREHDDQHASHALHLAGSDPT